MNRNSLFTRLISMLAFAILQVLQLNANTDNSGIDIYGSVINYGNGANGIYSFNTLKPGVFNAVKITENLSAEGGATLAGDNYYAIRADKTLHVYDIDTWKELYSTPVTNVTLDMTYDETSNQIFGCFVDDGPQLGVLIPQEGTYKKIGTMKIPACIMVCDNKGVLYAVGHDGVLYNVDKETAEMKEIGNTNIMPMFAQSAAIDPETNLCYWVSLAPDASSCLVELNLETAETGWIYDMPNGEEITGIFILPKINDRAPSKASDIKIDDKGENVLFKAPTLDHSGNILSDEKMDYMVEVYTDENKETISEVFSAMPGEELTYPIKKINGQIKVSVIFKNSHGNGEKAFLYFWMGEDSAGEVSDLNVSKINNNCARVSWNAPSKGEHGGSFDEKSIRYRIIRFPDNIALCDNLRENYFIDNIKNTDLRKYWYEVTPYTGNDKKGVSKISNEIVLGNPYELPYFENFRKDANDFDVFTVYDVNNDNDTWYYDDYAEKIKYAGNTEDKADDWLITPPVHIEAGNVCSFSFYTTVGFEGLYTEHLVEIFMGNKPGIEDLNVQLMQITKIPSTLGQEVKVKFETTKDDEYYFGIHLVSDGRCLEFSVDNITIEKKASIEGPAAVSDFVVTPGDKGGLKADISFTAPSKTYKGEILSSITKIEVFRDKEIIKTFKNAAPGEKFTLADYPNTEGMYKYKVICYNEKGSGDEAEINLFIGIDVPAEVQNINVTENEDGNVTITWDAPSIGSNGGYIETGSLKYTVLRNGWKPILEASSKTVATDSLDDITEGMQGIMQYQILVKTDAGKGTDAFSPFITVGEPFDVPFIESFIAGTCKYEPWSTLPRTNGTLWRYDVYNEEETCDGDKGMMVYTTQNEKPIHSMMLSPKVRIDNTIKPQLSFWLSNSAIDDDLIVEIWTNNTPVETAKEINLRKESDWTEYIIDLTPFKDNSSIQFAFHITNAVKKDRLYIDNIRITDNLTHNLAASNIKAPISLTAGKEGSLELEIINQGKIEADKYSVTFFNKDKVIDEVSGETTIQADSIVNVRTVFTPLITDIDRMDIHAVINYDKDENLQNNTSNSVVVTILEPEYPVIDDLNGTSDGKGNILNWSEPDLSTVKPSAITDDFESYESFTTKDLGEWTLIDVDKNQYSMEFKNSSNEWITYPNSGGAMSFQVVDLSKIKAGVNDGWSSISGNKILVCPYASNNDDWLISPELYPVEQEIVVNAKSLNYYEYGLESFTVLYSESDKETSSFIELGKAVDIPTTWTEYRFTIPQNARFFAVRAKNTNSALFIDDITFIPVSASPVNLKIEGYNVYRDYEKINNSVLTSRTYTDSNVDDMKEYEYNVTVLYNLGESGFSNKVTITADTGIKDVNSGISIYTDGGKIYVEGAKNQKIYIIDINGYIMYEELGRETSVFTVNHGIYTIKISDKTYKVLVK